MPRLIEAVCAAVHDAADRWETTPSRIVIGGRSMGGRAASMAVADGLATAGLLLLSYPLHPPGKPDRLRVEHFDQLTKPVLLVQGRSDPFGTPEEFAEHLDAIPGPVTQCWVDGNHDPRPTRDDQIVAATLDWLAPTRR
jgi:predicted alpha/beta-hydrolase family hydrolase